MIKLAFARMFALVAAILALLPAPAAAQRVGEPMPRTGDEIIVCGQLFHTTTPVVTWMDPGGYDGYRVERRFGPYADSQWDQIKDEVREPNRYNSRIKGAVPPIPPEQVEQVRGGGWTLEQMQDVVDQFVIHYDVCGTSRRCFKVLHDERCLSVHLMLDIDGTIYQTLDLKERAWHATTSNSRSIGIEIAQMGAYSPRSRHKLDRWYTSDDQGVRLTFPASYGELGLRTPNFIGRPARPELVVGEVQKTELYQYDFTPEQYAALEKLTATLCRVFPKLRCDYPKDSTGRVIMDKLPDAQLREYTGLLGHFHIQENKTDPGPAFDWQRVTSGAKRLLATE
ncbi:MAG: N-acetylmuramoyl-L-alanine amidase [Planctomycetota bacterium]